MRKDTQAVLLLLVGGTLLKISFTGNYVRYVKPGLFWLLVVTGVVLIAVAGMTLWKIISGRTEEAEAAARRRQMAYRAHHAYAVHEGHPELPVQRTGEEDDEPDDGDEHPHEHDRGRVGWLLLVPALALLIFAPPPVGAFQASRNGTALATQAGSEYAPLPAGDPVRVTLLDYAGRAIFDRGRSLAGRQIVMSGFVIPGPEGQPYLARMVVGCCAADARPVKIGLTGDVPSDLGPDEWIEVQGTYIDFVDRDPVNAESIPYLQVTVVRTITPPELQYE